MSMGLSIARIKELISYDPETGIFVRLITTSSRAQKGDTPGTLNADGYKQFMLDRVIYLAHRVAWFYMKGVWPEQELDHRNRVRDDNRFSNLRPASRAGNNQNLGISTRNSSGVKGVSKVPQTKKWKASIRVDGKLIYLGRHASLEEAAAARAKAELVYFTKLEGYNYGSL